MITDTSFSVLLDCLSRYTAVSACHRSTLKSVSVEESIIIEMIGPHQLSIHSLLIGAVIPTDGNNRSHTLHLATRFNHPDYPTARLLDSTM